MNTVAFIVPGLDKKPVMVKYVGLRTGSNNEKTGDMIQTYMLPLDWVEKKRAGDDFSVCGDCKHSQAKDADCYVRKGMTQLGLYGTMKAAPDAIWHLDDTHIQRVAGLCFGKSVRFGTYGEPVLMGEKMVSAICTLAKNWTGYSHQWRKKEHQWAKRYFMASVDNEEDMLEAHAMGWRTFRVKQQHEKNTRAEITCPASKEAGKKTTCAQCHLCKGNVTSAKSIVIIKH